jgi:UDP-2-acetamido-3-amino-2,3-dideoxy-glucuronate N-acetyltransferase
MNLVRCCARLGVLQAVCDADLHRLDEVRSLYEGVRIFCDYPTMLAEAQLDAVIVAAPAQLHARLALEAVEAGLHVFVEKPLALNVEDARRVVEAARRAQRVLVVGHLLLYHPAVRAMFKAIGEGKIGELRHLRSRRLSWGRLRAHEDVWWSFAPHDVAVMLEVFGEEPESASFSSSAFIRPHLPDIAYADFQFSGGRSAHIEVAWIDQTKASKIDVFGSKGSISVVDAADGAEVMLRPGGDRIGAHGEPELWKEEAQVLHAPPYEPLLLEVEAFCRACNGGPLPPSHGDEGLAVVRALALAHQLDEVTVNA